MENTAQMPYDDEPAQGRPETRESLRDFFYSRKTRFVLRALEVIVVVAAVCVLISTFFISVLQIRGTSMEPTFIQRTKRPKNPLPHTEMLQTATSSSKPPIRLEYSAISRRFRTEMPFTLQTSLERSTPTTS